MSTATTFAEGDVIAGRYVVERLIGKGGMGAVYAARNQNSGRKVALKVIKAGAEETVEQRRRFLREAKAATAIQHPNVIEVLDVFEDSGGTLVMVMELLAGETLLQPSFTSLIVPMWLAAVGIVLTASMTANGALAAFDDNAGMAVAVYFCVQSLIVSLAGTALVIFLPGDTAWPLITFCTFMPLLVLAMLARLRKS